jgi:hypothetical protein
MLASDFLNEVRQMPGVFTVYTLLALVVILCARGLRKGRRPIHAWTYVLMVAVGYFVAFVSLAGTFDRSLVLGAVLPLSRALGALVLGAFVVGLVDRAARHSRLPR